MDIDITTVIVVVLTVLLIGYLFATLLKPEKF
jgi:K+-transporting ATPase KdpF subunit